MCPLKGERGSEGANMARFSRCYLEFYEEMAGVIVACEIWKVRLEEAGKEGWQERWLLSFVGKVRQNNTM